MAGEILFADTNVFLAATDRSRAQHQVCRDLLVEAASGRFHLALSGQVVREYLVVATRPVDVNGLGLATSDALQNVATFTGPPFVFCDEPEGVSLRLRELAASHQLAGKRIHDANIVATMQAHGITRLLTLNPDDFAGFEGVTVSRPADAPPLPAGTPRSLVQPRIPRRRHDG